VLVENGGSKLLRKLDNWVRQGTLVWFGLIHFQARAHVVEKGLFPLLFGWPIYGIFLFCSPQAHCQPMIVSLTSHDPSDLSFPFSFLT
jgi:hypothetical protein